MVDGDRKPIVVFDGSWAWRQIGAATGHDRSERDESAHGRHSEGLLAGFFGGDGGARGDRDVCKRNSAWGLDRFVLRGNDDF